MKWGDQDGGVRGLERVWEGEEREGERGGGYNGPTLYQFVSTESFPLVLSYL